MIDDGELDWKLICIRGDDPLASQLNDVHDVERLLLGVLFPELENGFDGTKHPTVNLF